MYVCMLINVIMKVANEVWVATALLHVENPEREDFQESEIIARAKKEKLSPRLRAGFRTHVASHCVASKTPHATPFLMLTETGRGRRRLFREGDPIHEDREGGKTNPSAGELPRDYLHLVDWYRTRYSKSSSPVPMRGAHGKDLARFAGAMDEESARAMLTAIEEGCERVDTEGW